MEKSRYQSSVNQELCTGCRICVARCIFGAIEMVKIPGSKKLKAHVNPECYGYGACVIKCPVKGAIALKAVRRPKEYIPLAESARLQV